jgi:hypothetical protein
MKAVSVLLFLFSVLASANDQLDVTAISKIKATDSAIGNVFEYGAVGLLNDGGTYLVASVSNKGEVVEVERLAVFSKAANSTIAFVAKTKPWNWEDEDGLRMPTWNFKVKDKAIYVTQHDMLSYAEQIDEQLKFRIEAGAIVLIGYDHVFTGTGDGITFVESGSSANFLTNTAVHWRRTGKEIQLWNESVKWNSLFRITKADRSKEETRQFQNSKLWHFDQFDIDAFHKWLSKTAGLCGEINEKFKYRTCR